MAIVFEVKGKEQKVKFDFRTLFKANRKLSSTNPDTGDKNDDGAYNLFNQINSGSEEGIINLIQLTSSRKLTEDDALEAMDKYVEDLGIDEEEAYNQLFEDVKNELLDSGFFVGKLKKQIETIEKGIQALEKHGTEEQKEQIPLMKEQLDSLKKEIS